MKVTLVSAFKGFTGGRTTLKDVGLLLSITTSAALLSQEDETFVHNSPEYVLDDPENQQLLKPVRAVAQGQDGSRLMVWAYRNRFVTVHHWIGATGDEIAIAVAHAVLSHERQISDMEIDIERFLQGPEDAATPREPIPETVRRSVWQRDGGRCVRCGSQERLEYDHLIALAKGGSNTERNIQLLCESCNRKKGTDI